jgi:hypothetical protein
MTQSILTAGATGETGRTSAAGKISTIPSAQVWFAGGERAGYDPIARTIVRAQGAPLSVFLRREGASSHTVSFLPGFPDGSFGWAKVRTHLPGTAEMSKLFSTISGWVIAISRRTTFTRRRNEPTSPKRSGAI